MVQVTSSTSQPSCALLVPLSFEPFISPSFTSILLYYITPLIIFLVCSTIIFFVHYTKAWLSGLFADPYPTKKEKRRKKRALDYFRQPNSAIAVPASQLTAGVPSILHPTCPSSRNFLLI
jgi:hypothetical protein